MASTETAPTPHIYYYSGHGSDVCDVQTKKPTEDIVPEGCIYITIEECGKNVKWDEKQMNYFRDPKSTDILAHPEKNKEAIAEHLGISVDKIHIRKAGDEYVVANLYPFSFWNEDTFLSLGLSGLLEKKKMEKLNPDIKNLDVTLKNDNMFKIFDKYQPITKEAAYKMVLRICNKQKNDKVLKPMMRRGLAEETKDKFYSTFRKIDILSTEHIERFLRLLYESFDVEDILNMYEASVLPTKADIKKILDTTFPDRTYITLKGIAKFEQALNDFLHLEDDEDIGYMTYLPVTNKNMMAKYPGVHYNMVCRDIPEECREKIEEHRSKSRTRATKQKGGTRKSVNRNKEVKYIQNTSTDKQWFRIPKSQKKFPGQLIRLYASTLKNDFPGQQLKISDPKEYLQQKQKLKIHNKVQQNLNTTRRQRRGTGSRGSRSIENITSDVLAWLERMEKE